MKFNIERLKNIRDRFAENRIDALFLTTMENIRYLSDFRGSSAYMLITKEREYFITDFRYKTEAKNKVDGYKVVIFRNSIIDEIKRLIKRDKISHLGVEKMNITLEKYQKLTKELKKIKIVPTFNLIEGIRAVKAPPETKNIIESIRRAEDAYKDIETKIKSGVPEKDIALDLEYSIKKSGSNRLPFEIIVASGYRSALPHATAGGRLLRNKDLVIIDFGAEYEGYYSDITRTSIIGDCITKRQRVVYNTVLNAQGEAIDLIRHGIKAKDVDAAARRVITKAGYGKYFGHGTGHGVGLMIHESPTVSPKSDDILKEGMIFTVEPAIYIPGWGGIRIEDMVLVTKTGCRVLTSLPKEI